MRRTIAQAATVLGVLIAGGALGVTLSGCAARDPYVTGSDGATRVGSWRIERGEDRVTGLPISSSALPASVTTSTQHLIARNALLQLLCFQNAPVVRIAFNDRVGSNRNSMLGYRFDDRPGKEAEARFLRDYKTVVIEDPDEVAAFAEAVTSARQLYVRIRSLNNPRTSAEFTLAGGAEAVKAAYAGCPVKQTAKRAGG